MTTVSPPPIFHSDLFAHVINSAQELIWGVDRDYKLVFANKLFLDTYFTSTGAHILVGDYLINNDYPEELVVFWRLNIGKSFDGETLTLELPKMRNGVLHYVETKLFPFLNTDNLVEYVLCISQDVTGEKRIALEKIKTADKYQYLFDNMSQGVVYHDNTGAIISANSAALDILGLSMEQLLGRTAFDPRWKAINADGSDFPVEEHPANITRKTGMPVDNVLMGVFHPRENAYRWILISSKPVCQNENNSVIAVFATFTDITTLRQTEESLINVTMLKKQLTQLHVNFSRFFNAITDFLFILDMDGNILHCNETVCRRLGYAQEELIGMSVLKLHPVSEYARAKEIALQMIKGCIETSDVPLTSKRGDLIFVETTISMGEWNTNPAIYSVSKDISKLKKSEAKFKTLFNKPNITMLLINPVDGSIVDANSAAVSFYGYSKAVICTMTIFDINILDEITVRDLIEKSTNDDLNTFVFQHKIASGEIRTVEVNSSPIEVNNQKWLFSIIFDVTERKAAEKALDLERIRLENVISYTDTALWEWEVQTGKMVFNERWADIIGYKLSELEPIDINTWGALIHPEDLLDSRRLLDEHFTGRSEYFDADRRMKHKNGHWVWVNTKGRVIAWDANGKPLKIIGTHQDISFRKNNEAETMRLLEMDQLEKSSSQLRKLAAHLQSAIEDERLSISRELHDNLGQSLTALKLQLFQLKMNISNQSIPVLDEIIGNVNQMIEQTRYISKKLRPPMLDELGIVEALVCLVDDVRKKCCFQIEIKTNVSVLKIKGNKAIEIYRIVQEALTNIIRHASASSVILEIHVNDQHLIITVIDDGIGINDVELNQKNTLGILGMKERAKILGTDLIIDGHPNGGTKVKLKMPNEIIY